MARQVLIVEGTQVALVAFNGEDYISLTDMVRESESGSSIIENWLRDKDTLEFLSIWESIYNPSFNSLEFEGVEREAGLFAVGSDVTITELAQPVQRVVGIAGQSRFDSSKPDGAPRKLMEVPLLAREGRRASTTLVDGLTRTYRQFSE